jgi:benzoyl-CoA reductase subunit C
VPCPTKHPPSRRLEFLLAEAKSRQVDGVVFLLQKFCDPHAFDYPAFRDALEASGRPCLPLEIERGGLPAGQARTRVEAFLERLRSSGQAVGGGGGRP